VSRARDTPARRRLTVLLVLLAVAVAALHGPAPASAAPRQASAGGLRLELVGQRLAFGPGGNIRLEYRLSGDLAALAELEPSDASVTSTTTAGPDETGESAAETAVVEEPLPLILEIANYPAIGAGDEIGDFIGGDVDPASFQDAIDGVVVGDLRDRASFDDHGSVTFELVIPTDMVDSQPERLRFDEPGLYPLRVQLLVGDSEEPSTTVTHGTVVQRTSDGDRRGRPTDPLDVSLLAAIEDPGPIPDDAEERGAARRLEAIAAASERLASPFTLSLPPSVLTPATGDAAAQQALDASFVDDELVVLPATAFDVSAAVAADEVEAYAIELSAGADELTAALPLVPSRRDVYVAAAPLSASGAQALRDLGTRIVVMTADIFADTVGPGVDAPIDQLAEIALPDGGSLPLIVVDPIGEQLTPAGAAAELADLTAVEWAVRTITSMLVGDPEQATSAGQRSRVLATPDLAAPDVELLDALETLVETTPDVRMTPTSSLTGVTDVATDGGRPLSIELPDVAGPSIETRVQMLNGTKLVIANASSMLSPDDPRPPEWTARIDELVASGYPDAYVEAESAAIRREAEELLGAIVAPEPFTFTLTGKSGDIEMRIGNLADEPLAVKLRMSSPKLTFPSGDQLVELRPNSETSVVVPVRALANGTSSVTVEILTPVDQPITAPVTLTSRVNALTGLGQVLTGGLILVLLTWWFNHWRARRREAAASGDAASGEPAASAG
jgi:hypothetical protein